MIILLLAIGLILGSFVNALVWRLRKQEEIKFPAIISKRERQLNESFTEKSLSLVYGRSMCPECHHTLATRDLLPVFSWIFLGGKCRYCKKPIPWQYPIVELLTSVLFLLSYVLWPYGFDMLGWVQFASWLIFLTGFIALTVYDILWQELPDRIVWPLTGLALVQTLFLVFSNHDWYAVIWPALGTIVISGLFWVLFAVSKGKWIGFGDVKVGLILGLLAGNPLRALLVIFFASLLGTAASIPMLIQTKKGMKLHIPFGPFLIAGLMIVYFFGDSIIGWYSPPLY